MAYREGIAYGGFYAYGKAIVLDFVAANQYHAIHLVTAGDIVAGILSGFTFNAGRTVDTNITSEANGTGGKLRIICSVPHGLSTGDLVVLTNMNNAGHNKPTRVTIDATNPTTEFLCDDITYVAGAGASAGNVDMPACLKASAGSAGVYSIAASVNGTCAAANKVIKLETNTNVTANDNTASSRTSTNSLGEIVCSGHITIAVGDCVWLSMKNITDSSNFTIENLNMHLSRIG